MPPWPLSRHNNLWPPSSELRYPVRDTYPLAVIVKKPATFGRSGRPRKINLSDLFLWSPNIELELMGVSLSDAIGEENPEMLSLVRDLGRKRNISDKRAQDVISAALKEMNDPLAAELRKALKVEGSSVSSMGAWQIFFYSQSLKRDGDWPPKLPPFGQHFIEIEQALKEPTMAWQQDDMARCANLLKASRVLAPYLWPEVIGRLRDATTVGEANAARGMVMLEFYLSFLACLDAQVQVDGYAEESLFEVIFPDFSVERAKQPNALFFTWLADYSGEKATLASKIHQINKPARDTSIDSTKRQLRQWKNGGSFPSLDMLDALYRNLYGDKARDPDNPRHKDWELSWRMAVATKRIRFLCTILLPLRGFREPTFPFCHQTVQEWRESRYPHWYRYWLRLLKKPP